MDITLSMHLYAIDVRTQLLALHRFAEGKVKLKETIYHRYLGGGGVGGGGTPLKIGTNFAF